MIKFAFILLLSIRLVNLKERKKKLNTDVKKVLEKSKLEVLTYENDFLVKNLKKAGWFTRAFKYFSNN